MSITRAYACLHIKAVDEDARVITGIATTPEPDRVGDIVEPKGAQFKLPIPLLWQHDSRQPIGHVTAAKVTDKGIEIKAQLIKLDEPGALKDRLDEAWQSVKSGLVRGLSIGFKEIESARIEGTFSFRYLKWLWLELSAVTIPANGEATITAIKSIDAQCLAALGTSGSERSVNTPGATGTPVVKVLPSRSEQAMKGIADQLNSYKSTRDQKFQEQQALMTKAGEAGLTLDEAESQQYDTLESEIKALDTHIARLERMVETNKAAAVPVAGATPEQASVSRSGQTVIQVRDRLEPGQRFARYAMCVAAAKGDPDRAVKIAKTWYPDERSIHQVLEKGAIPAATTANNAGPALQYTDWMGDFVDYLRPQTILGKFGSSVNGVSIPALRSAPFKVRIVTQTAGSSGYWVGEGLPKPATKGTYGTTTLDFHKVATIAVLTQEEVRFTSPSAELKVRDDIAAALVARIDQDFIDPTNAGTANVKPASITNGVAASSVSGTDYDNFIADLAGMLSNFTSNNIPLNSVVLVMSDTIAMKLSLMRTSLGVRFFPDISATGGRIEGFPVIVSEYVTSLGSPAGSMIVAVAANEVYLADDGGVSIDSSTEASVEMLDSSLQQDATAGTGASLVSLWQNNLLGLRAEREITWKKRRTAAAQYLAPVAYTPAVS